MCVLDRPFRSVALPVAPLGDFLNAEKVTKDPHRERVFPLKGLSRWAAVATFYLNEPSPATTEVGSRSPFWNPLRVVQCLPLPMNFLAKIDLAQKRLWFAEALPSLGGNQRGTAHGSSLAVQGWGFKRGGDCDWDFDWLTERVRLQSNEAGSSMLRNTESPAFLMLAVQERVF